MLQILHDLVAMQRVHAQAAVRGRLNARRVKNRVGLDRDLLRELAIRLARLDALNSGLGLRSLRHVVDDEDDGVLLDLAAREGGGALLELQAVGGAFVVFGVDSAWRDVLVAPLLWDAGFFLRFGRVLEAASRREARQLRQSTPELPAWLEILLREISMPTIPGLDSPPPLDLDFELIEAMLVADDQPADLAVRAFALSDPADDPWTGGARLFEDLTGRRAAFERHPDAVHEALAARAAVRKAMLERLVELDEASLPAVFVEAVVDAALDTAKSVRAVAEEVVGRQRELCLPVLHARLTAGGAAARRRAARLLWRLEGTASLPRLEAALGAESSAKNRQAIEQILHQAASVRATDDGATEESVTAEESGAGGPAGEPVVEPVLEPVPPVALDVPLSVSTRDALRVFCSDWTAKATEVYERQRRRDPRWAQRPTPLTAADADRLYEAMQRPVKLTERQRARLDRSWFEPDWSPRIRGFLARPELEPIHAIRFLGLIGEADLEPRRTGPRGDVFGWSGGGHLDHYRATHADRLDLRTLGAVFEALGFDAATIGWQRLRESWGYRAFRWPPDAVWPYFAEHVEILEQALVGRGSLSGDLWDWDLPGVRRSAFEIVSWFPSVPESLRASLWEVALGTRKSERELAQAALDKEPNKRPVIVAALGDGKQHVRATAAAWLARLGATQEIPALEKALRKEKQELVKGALLQALEDLGADVERYLDREQLARDAARGLRKAPPKALEWFPFALLPVCRWRAESPRDDQAVPVDPQIVRWFVVRCNKLKSPAPGPILRRHCRRMVRADREALGRFVLDAWIAHDTRRPSRAEAEEKAVEQLNQWGGASGRHAQRLLESFARGFLEQPIGSAIQSKGVLALAAACGGPVLAERSARYLTQWYGQRAAQCKALLEMLAWVDDDSDGGQATQRLLATANRFRTASIRKHAEALAAELAERRGWTVAELADRTVPTAGLELADDGPPRLTLRYGRIASEDSAGSAGEAAKDAAGDAAEDAADGRQFTAVLADDLTLSLRTAEGKAIKSLPAARKSEDADAVKATKKELTRAKKELKGVVRLQTDRLYEALCTQRAWPVLDWRRFLIGHPIVSRLCRRLVWVAFEPATDPGDSGEERLVASFRPLADGTLTDAADEAVELPESASVRLAHDANLPPAEIAAWLEHLDDYEIVSLFEQIGRDVFELPVDRRDSETLDDFEGHMLDAFALRSAANRRGYVRGQAEDGGWFLTYHKSFPTLELEAVLEFTGNALPEENRRVALRSLHLVSTAGLQHSDAHARPRQRLSEVPPVLLGELWNDLRVFSDLGSGYDPAWESNAWE
ncbi:MAG: DUF4132 domain-containing protein [Acidobacteriota bacterium]